MRWRIRSGAAASAVLLLLLVQVAAEGEYPGTRSPALTEQSLVEAYSSCTIVEGDLIIGFADCSSQCNLTSLSPLTALRSISGSLVIQCCPYLEELSGLNELTAIAGTLRIYYNQRLHTISGLGALSNLGSLEISQNGNLTRVSGLSSLGIIGGHLQINHNQRLVSLDGLSGIRSIGGADLVAEHALVVLYNPSLPDLRWLRNLSRIEFGTVHIEGNSELCYAGYPQWMVGGFAPRPPTGDRGVDWRRFLGGVPLWQYSWGEEGGGYPTLVVQNNAGYNDCGEASCHEACEVGAGCLGPSDPDLCGSCDEGFCEIGATPTTASCDPTPIPYWPPTELPYSLLFGALFAICGLVLLGLVLLGGWVAYRICKRLRTGRKDTFDIVNEEMEMVGVELKRRETDNSGIIAGTSSSLRPSSRTAHESSAETKGQSQRAGNVVLTSLSYKPLTSEVESPPPHTSVSVHTTPPPHLSDTSPIPSPSSTLTHPLPAVVPPPVLAAQTQQELRGSLRSIPEELEEEEGEGEGREETDGVARSTPVRRLHKQDTLTRLQKGESAHIQLNFPRSQIKLKKEIGKGDFGLVFFAEARRLVSGEKKTPVIVKQLKENSSKQEQENFLRPVEAMSEIQHQNVLSLLGACVDGSPIMILMEYCPHGNLKTYLVRKRRETASFREGGRLVTIACQMATGLTYLHSNSIAHNDFAVRSCLVSDSETVKLGDYGLTRQVFEEDYYSRGGHQKAWPVRWMAPEQMIVRGTTVLDSHPVSSTANVWSFGVSLWEVGTFAQWPYFDLSNEEVIDTVQSSWQCSLENPFQSSDPLSPLYDIMQLCWKPPGERLTMVGVLQRLEELQEDIARNTPSSRKRKSISLSHSPNTTPKTTPPEPRPNPTPNTAPIPTKPRPKKATPTNTPPGTHSKRATPTELHKKATPTATPPEPRPKVTKPAGSPQRATAGTRKGGKSYAPRRPAPKVPEEGSLKRGSTAKQTSAPIDAHQQQSTAKQTPVPIDAHQQQSTTPVPIDAHQQHGTAKQTPVPIDAHQHRHPLEKSLRPAETENQPEKEPTDFERESATVATVRVNPGFAETEDDDEGGITGAVGVGGGEEMEEGRETKEGVLFVNRVAEEAEERGEEVGQREGDIVVEMETGKGGEWDFEEDDQREWGDEDFILEPPIDFSQPGAEEDDFPGGHLYNPNESQCTSIDDFEPIPDLPPSPKPPPKELTRGSGFTTTHDRASAAGVDSKQKKKQKKKRRREGEDRRGRGDGTQPSPLLTYHARRETAPREVEGGKESWNEPKSGDEGEEDSRYRRPSGQISKALLRRAPSWGRSGHSETEEELPNVVYDDEISALIW